MLLIIVMDAEIRMDKDRLGVPWKGVSFSCGGWLQFYLFGVVRAMQVRGVDKNVRVAGCSAGALAAAGAALGVSLMAFITRYHMYHYRSLFSFRVILTRL